MKKSIRALSLFLVVISVVFLLAGCSNAREKYLGTWNGYKMVYPDGEIKLSDFASIAKLELTVNFSKDGTYVMHYYVNGKEGDNYPQSGKYKMDGDKIQLEEGYGEIVSGELILYLNGGKVKQYYSR